MEVTNLLDIHTREELYAWYLEHHATVADFWLRVMVAGDAWWVVCNCVRCFLSLRKCLPDRQMLPMTGLRWISKKGRGLEPLCIGVGFSQWGVEGN